MITSNSVADEFPLVCETCLGPNPLVRMTRLPHGKPCKICERPFTVFRWKPDGEDTRHKKTELCSTCAKLKNVCQTCVLDLHFNLPVQVRDSALSSDQRVILPNSQVGRDFAIEQYEASIHAKSAANTVGGGSSSGILAPGELDLNGLYGKATSSNRTLQKLSRKIPNYDRNRAHLCSFYARGQCNRGTLCPYRHEMPTENDLSRQNIKERYLGLNDPVAKKMLADLYGGSHGPIPSPPNDPSITTIWVSGFDQHTTELDLQRVFVKYGELSNIHMVLAKRCAFVTFAQRVNAEDAMQKLHGSCVVNGQSLQLDWGKSKRANDYDSPHSSASQSDLIIKDSMMTKFTNIIPVVMPTLLPPPGMSSSITYPSQSPHHQSSKLQTF